MVLSNCTLSIPIVSTGLVDSLSTFPSISLAVYNKLIRYYISNTGEKLLKIKNDSSDSGAAAVSQVEAGEWLATVCNQLNKNHPLDNVNYSYYIERAEKLIRKIETEGKARKVVTNPNQLSLF